MRATRVLCLAYLIVAVVALIIAITTPTPAVAQNSCIKPVSCGYSSIGSPCLPPLPPGSFNCSGSDFTVYCSVRSQSCPPALAVIEIPRCIECERLRALAGQPINLATGDVYIDQTDVSLPGLGGGLTLTRSWNSLWPSSQNAFQMGIFGPNWRSTYEERIFVGDDGFIKYSRSDGNFWSFGYNSSNWLPAAPANVSATLTQNSTSWVLTFKNGEQRLFDLTSGMLTAIIDRNGNTTQLTRDGLNRLVTVTDPASRHLNFTYTGSSSYLVAGITSDVGLSLTYSYDSNGRLSQVTKPDQSTLNFEYNDPNPYYIQNEATPYITAVKDSNGKVLESHTYDCFGRGTSSSRANGVEALTVTYSGSSFLGGCTTGP